MPRVIRTSCTVEGCWNAAHYRAINQIHGKGIHILQLTVNGDVLGAAPFYNEVIGEDPYSNEEEVVIGPNVEIKINEDPQCTELRQLVDSSRLDEWAENTIKKYEQTNSKDILIKFYSNVSVTLCT